MSRILFLADTQIGVGTVSLADQREVLDQIVHLAWEHAVHLVVHGGDVFEGPVVTPEQMRMFLDAWEPIREMAIPTLVLRGNGRHDSAVRSVHALDVLREVPGFDIADRPGVFRYGDVDICALPWVHPGTLIARQEGPVDHDLVNAAAADLLVRIANDLAAAASAPKLLVAHWAISGAALPSGMKAEEMREPVIPWAELDALGYDVIVGAHIHQPQFLSLNELDIDKTPGFVIGSPQQLNFGEKGEHGCWIVDVGDRPSTGFVPIPSRQFVTLDFDHEDPVAQFALSHQIGWDLPEGAIVRVRMKLTDEQAQRIDPAEYRRSLLEAGVSSVRLDLDVQRESRRRAEINESLSPAEAMTLYCEAAGIEEPLRGELVKTITAWSEE